MKTITVYTIIWDYFTPTVAINDTTRKIHSPIHSLFRSTITVSCFYLEEIQ